MQENNKISGFSKLNREEKIRIASQYATHPVEFVNLVLSNMHAGLVNNTGEHFTENAISEFSLPYSVAPNFLIDGKVYMIPMVTEESSVVAAASSAAKFWFDHGGFHTRVSNMVKPGHIHFLWYGATDILNSFFNDIVPGLKDSVEKMIQSMEARGGGIQSIRLTDETAKIEHYYRIEVLFNTVDAMGANFINSCLETMAEFMISQAKIRSMSHHLDIIMSILSNYTPECIVKCSVSCHIHDLSVNYPEEFARRFAMAVNIAKNDVNRAVTHNKGIYNGIDAVILATGNDYRATEAAGHSWASRKGKYEGLSDIEISGNEFRFSIAIPLAVGVTGGITNLHPMTRASLQLLGNPDARTLMSVAASAGMANHFSAIKALITHGIQKGHMKLHLVNILTQLNADEIEKQSAMNHFAQQKVTFQGVREYLSKLRSDLP